MNSQFKKGALELIVLLIIKKDDQYGYSLVQNISRHMSIAEGTVYPLLRRLVKNGELTTYYQPSTEGPARKYYRITDQGIQRLADLLQEWQLFSDTVEIFIKESDIND
ncbi:MULTISPECIES: PadR family transcriptional regulator [Staphylococcus]|jgi:PadR family transcriptional regulator PadR|uniref:PadR family transcriptional regulator n=1 Tax=Staphylococcus nepalensis TaxID=214473 RepID=A0A2T4S8Y2_9STAP|nr:MULTISPECIES: PadR family transcriptional regulator [Staphylococcus]VDG66337.1 padr-family transcriptional regulator [Lacrimispora indolis]MBO1205717.1 PadR family transcriptional regulator [Staphylococcus nepalensis]MBO1212745.1 PadR family transcriptional regulator [Staphylococcus nepalensis]MBO1215810.1 PadR family transcriptional regulator [Staphylococcus nepalensis]MBO1221181.1 PadR family transcriptional regulator [Staphylococcus nepalensis]